MFLTTVCCTLSTLACDVDVYVLDRTCFSPTVRTASWKTSLSNDGSLSVCRTEPYCLRLACCAIWSIALAHVIPSLLRIGTT